jgi:hypothetical protein
MSEAPTTMSEAPTPMPRQDTLLGLGRLNCRLPNRLRNVSRPRRPVCATRALCSRARERETWVLKAWVVVAALALSSAMLNSRSSLATEAGVSVLLPHAVRLLQLLHKALSLTLQGHATSRGGLGAPTKTAL